MKLTKIEKLSTRLFHQRWKSFREDKFSDVNLKFPGVYVLSYTHKNLAGQPISERDILYVGMSNSQGGVQSRLKQFRNGLEKNDFHSGAMRFFREYQADKPFSSLRTRKKFFYAALTIECISEKSKLSASDLREFGHVSCLEYYVIARVKSKTDRTPIE